MKTIDSGRYDSHEAQWGDYDSIKPQLVPPSCDALIAQARRLANELNDTLDELAEHGVSCLGVQPLFRDPGMLRMNERVILALQFQTKGSPPLAS